MQKKIHFKRNGFLLVTGIKCSVTFSHGGEKNE